MIGNNNRKNNHNSNQTQPPTEVALKDTQKHVNGLQEKWGVEEKMSATSLMILSHLMMTGLRNTKRKSRHLNVLVVNLNGKKIIVLCNTK